MGNTESIKKLIPLTVLSRHISNKQRDSINLPKHLSHLFCLHKVGHLSVVICSSDVESRAGSLWAEAGEDAGLGLFVSCIDGPDLHTTAHQPQQPVITVHSVVLQVQVQRLVPIDLLIKMDTKANTQTNSVWTVHFHTLVANHTAPISHIQRKLFHQRDCADYRTST